MFMNLLTFRMFQLSPLVVFKRSQQPNVERHGLEMAEELCLKMPDFNVTFRYLLHAVNLRHGTDGFTSPPKEGVLRIFFALKKPTSSVGFEPANLGTKGQHATLYHRSRYVSNYSDIKLVVSVGFYFRFYRSPTATGCHLIKMSLFNCT